VRRVIKGITGKGGGGIGGLEPVGCGWLTKKTGSVGGGGGGGGGSQCTNETVGEGIDFPGQWPGGGKMVGGGGGGV